MSLGSKTRPEKVANCCVGEPYSQSAVVDDGCGSNDALLELLMITKPNELLKRYNGINSNWLTIQLTTIH